MNRHVLIAAIALACSGCAPSTPVEPSSAAPPAEPSPVESPPPAEPPPSVEPPPPAEPPAPEEPEPIAQTRAHEVPPEGFKPIPAKRKKGFPGIAFAEVRAYAFDLRVSERPVCDGPLDDDGSLCSTVAQPTAVLSETQTKTLLGLLAKRDTWGSGAACWLPHHGFVFYDAAGVPVAEISVCFMCGMLSASPAIPNAKHADEGSGYGVSEEAIVKLRGLCNELGLPKCDAKQPTDFGGS